MMLEKKHTLLCFAAAVCVGTVLYALVAPTVMPKKTGTKVSPQKTPTIVIEQKVTPAARTVTVTNKIDKKMTGYRKMGKNWYPDDWSLSVNGTQISTDAKTTVVACANKACKLVFSYDFRPFGTSYKKGTEELDYIIPEAADALEVTFSWYEKPCITVIAHEPKKSGNKESLVATTKIS